MKITTLMENTPCADCYAAEHGLSLFIETKTKTVLFDSGPSEAFADNAEKLGVDLGKADIAVLSHGHYDHSGGLLRFLRLNSKAPVYMQKDAFEEHFNNQMKDIGVDPALRNSDRIVFTDGEQPLAEGVTLYTCNGAKPVRPIETNGMTVKRDGVLHPEDFRHEQYLLNRRKRPPLPVQRLLPQGDYQYHELVPPGRAGGRLPFYGRGPGRSGKSIPDRSGGNTLQV